MSIPVLLSAAWIEFILHTAPTLLLENSKVLETFGLLGRFKLR